ncbi:MAG: hypothetical protein K2Q32_07365 [Alphaproteobacteria bacterium]|nr:hypothetical protein [Alphaproteobacteria bacterium]
MRSFVFALLCIFLLLSSWPFASAQTFKYEMNPYSSVGKVTGGKCLVHEDCVNGYTAHVSAKDKARGKKLILLCLTKKQAAGRRVDENHIPSSSLICGCLPDVKLCGYGYAEEMYR